MMPDAATRREWLRRAALLGAAGLSGRLIAADDSDAIELPFANGRRPLVKFPQKRELMLITRRPPQLETPFAVFNEGIITPNDAFFVRYHLREHSSEDRRRDVPLRRERQREDAALAGHR